MIGLNHHLADSPRSGVGLQYRGHGLPTGGATHAGDGAGACVAWRVGMGRREQVDGISRDLLV